MTTSFNIRLRQETIPLPDYRSELTTKVKLEYVQPHSPVCVKAVADSLPHRSGLEDELQQHLISDAPRALYFDDVYIGWVREEFDGSLC
jgi:hypothetical protein